MRKPNLLVARRRARKPMNLQRINLRENAGGAQDTVIVTKTRTRLNHLKVKPPQMRQKLVIAVTQPPKPLKRIRKNLISRHVAAVAAVVVTAATGVLKLPAKLRVKIPAKLQANLLLKKLVMITISPLTILR